MTPVAHYKCLFLKLWSQVSQILFIFFQFHQFQLQISQIDNMEYNPFCDESLHL